MLQSKCFVDDRKLSDRYRIIQHLGSRAAITVQVHEHAWGLMWARTATAGMQIVRRGHNRLQRAENYPEVVTLRLALDGCREVGDPR
jgi:hypothetical protein